MSRVAGFSFVAFQDFLQKYLVHYTKYNQTHRQDLDEVRVKLACDARFGSVCFVPAMVLLSEDLTVSNIFPQRMSFGMRRLAFKLENLDENLGIYMMSRDTKPEGQLTDIGSPCLPLSMSRKL